MGSEDLSPVFRHRVGGHSMEEDKLGGRRVEGGDCVLRWFRDNVEGRKRRRRGCFFEIYLLIGSSLAGRIYLMGSL